MGSTSLVVTPNRPVLFSVGVNVCHLKLQNVTHETKIEPPAPFRARTCRVMTKNRERFIFLPLPCHVHHVWILVPGIHPADGYCLAFLVSGNEQNAVLYSTLVAPAVFNLRERTLRSHLNVQRRIGLIRLFSLPWQAKRRGSLPPTGGITQKFWSRHDGIISMPPCFDNHFLSCFSTAARRSSCT